MNAKELIDVLTKGVKPKDREIAEIELWCGLSEYKIKSISGFGLSPDIVIQIEPTTSPIVKPATFKKEHSKMVKNKLNEMRKI